MTTGLSLSTMSARGHYDDLLEFSKAALDWGYSAIEANAYVTTHGMLERLASGPLPLSSLHNPTPNARSSLGKSSYDLNLSSLEETERREALGFAFETIEQAARYGAKAVVLHMGHVPIGKEMQRVLHDLWHECRTQSPEYIQVQQRIPELRARTAADHLERALETLLQLQAAARDRGILLGIETRHNLHEVPNVDEMQVMLDAADPQVVGYWHDTGHAATHEQLGFTTQEEWLRRHSHRMIGIHLHDMNFERDHQCPGNGTIDWNLVARHIPEGAIRVCEIGEWNEIDELELCPRFLASQGIVSPTGIDSAVR